MAESSVADILKEFAQNVSTSKVSHRRIILGNVATCIENGELPEAAVKGVLKYLGEALGLYRDGVSRRATERVITALGKVHGVAVVKPFCTSLQDLAEAQRAAAERSAAVSSPAFTALSWSCALLRALHGQPIPDPDLNALISIQGLLLHGCLAVQQSTPFHRAAAKRLTRLWSEDAALVAKYSEAVQSMDLYGVCVMSELVRHVATDPAALHTLTLAMLTLWAKLVLGSKTRPPRHLLAKSRDLLRHATHQQFREVLLPAAEKAMLRSPELLLEAVVYLLAGIDIDLSQYAGTFGGLFGTQLTSKEESVRAMAVRGITHLAHQCSDPDHVSQLVQHLFGVLGGSAGKLSLTEQRRSVLSAVGATSDNAVSGSGARQGVAAAACLGFLPFLQQEVHEGTLVHALSMLSSWGGLLTTDLPPGLVPGLQAAMALKAATATVRFASVRCLAVLCDGDRLLAGLPLVPALLACVEKAAAQTTNIAMVCEAAAAAMLLTKLAVADVKAEAAVAPLWPYLCDTERALLTHDKFLAAASEEALICVASLVERLLLVHVNKISIKVAALYHRAFVHTLCHGPYAARAHAAGCARRVLAALAGPATASLMIRQLADMLQSGGVRLRCGEAAEGGGTTSRALAEALTTLATAGRVEGVDAERLACETLLPAHHPLVTAYKPSVWTDIVAKLHLDAADLVAAYADSIMDKLLAGEITLPVQNCLATLARVAPDVVLPRFMTHVCAALSDPGYDTVTATELAIMHTPAGELYDKTLLAVAARQVDTANMKRENKLYSYKEQLLEQELRKELAAMGKAPPEEKPTLTKKQQEAVAGQLASEAATRDRLLPLDGRLAQCVLIVSALVRGNPTGVRCHVPGLLPRLVSLLASPLAAPRLTPLWMELRGAALAGRDQLFTSLVAVATIRLRQPNVALSSLPTVDPWCAEPLELQATRALQLLPAGSTLPATAFCYYFYLIQGVLESESLGLEPDVLISAVECVAEHARVRGEESDTEVGPTMLPRMEMLRLLVATVEAQRGRLQLEAASALVDVAMAGSGTAGCAEAEVEEVHALLDGLLLPSMLVREATLQSLLALSFVLPAGSEDEHGDRLMQRVWVARHDDSLDVSKLADKLWEEAGLEVNASLSAGLVRDIIHPQEVVRGSAARALAAVLEEDRSHLAATLRELLGLYEEKLFWPPPVLDELGRVVADSPPDEFPARCGIASAITSMAPYLSEADIQPLFTFLVEKGLRDRNDDVRKAMLAAAVASVDVHGKAQVASLLSVFEDFLAAAPDSAALDTVRQSVVILMGSLAKHLDVDDPKVKPIVAKLIETLSTPSQPVQEAVANCLPPLVPAVKEDAPLLVEQLLRLLLEAENYGERRGAAYGLAGLVRGLGILALKQLNVMATLTAAIQNKKCPRYREGALFAFEMLCKMLGRLFEPYIVHILPHLLLCFGDANQYVREAADDTAKAVMSKLSAHGVKLVLPSLLTALEEDSWRTKTGSVELLGAMAFCAPKQLSACLPAIVPKLMEVLTDAHVKVQAAGAQALRHIGSVIKNPEIQAIVPTLLEALEAPTKRTTPCLQALLHTKFVHFIDAPSLALIMPVVQRAFNDRATDTRKMAAQIIGNMYSLTDQKDLSPYLPHVIPGLKTSLLDPVPEVRSVSARALGAMIKGMGEAGFEDLLPWLMRTLTSEQSAVDRSGAAQGLSEVVGGLGVEKLEQLMPDIIATAERADIQAHVRDGYMMMYIYLPAVFGDRFMKYVGPIIPSILKALADENEFVRDTALRAGQRIINLYADRAIQLLLPELEQGLFDDNWRIRYASVQLLGDLLYKISGTSGKMTTASADDDDNFGTEVSTQAIFEALGEERRNRVLAGLYMGRSDTALMVRQASLHVWKVIVSHTPKTLRQILATLFSLLLGCLASPQYDKRQIGARTLGDVVRKLGEKVLPEIIPILEQGLESPRADQRQGVCIGLSEIMASTSRDHVIVFADSLVPTVRRALCDPLPEVREAAAKTFDNLHSNIGERALSEILPALLTQLEDPATAEHALDGLTQVMTVKSHKVLPYLVPQLIAPPANTRALSLLAPVAGDALTRHLGKILPALIAALRDKQGSPEEEDELSSCRAVVLSVCDGAGLRVVMDDLLANMARQEDPGLRWAAVTLLHAFCTSTKADYADYLPQLFRGLLALFTDHDPRVLHAAWDCLNAVIKQLEAADMLAHITNIRQALRFAVSELQIDEDLPGLCLDKKGLGPVWAVYREGILNGPQELKETAAVGLGEAIRRTSAAALKASVVNITGPLIRVLGDRFTFTVKVAVLDTLALLLAKCGVMLKPFLPQLQTTFLKALHDPQRAVRLRAASALARLVTIHTRVDPLFIELQTGVASAEEVSVRDTMLQAMRGCLAGAALKMATPARIQVLAALLPHLSSGEATTRCVAAACVGALCHALDEEELSALCDKQLLESDPSLDWMVRHGRAVALSVALQTAAERLTEGPLESRTLAVIHDLMSSDRVPLCLAGVRCAGFLLAFRAGSFPPLPLAPPHPTSALLTDLVKCLKAESNDVKAVAAQAVGWAARASSAPLELPVIKMLVPMLVNGTKEKGTVVRSSSETALVTLLRLRHGDNTLQDCSMALEAGARDSLAEVTKVLRRVAAEPESLDDLDDTVLV